LRVQLPRQRPRNSFKQAHKTHRTWEEREEIYYELTAGQDADKVYKKDLPRSPFPSKARFWYRGEPGAPVSKLWSVTGSKKDAGRGGIKQIFYRRTVCGRKKTMGRSGARTKNDSLDHVRRSQNTRKPRKREPNHSTFVEVSPRKNQDPGPETAFDRLGR